MVTIHDHLSGMKLLRPGQNSRGAYYPTEGSPYSVNRSTTFKRSGTYNFYPNNEYRRFFIDRREWCELCNVPCMNKDLLKQHLGGKRHKAKLQKLGLVESHGNGTQRKWCSLCEVLCNDELSFRQHLEGKKHALRLCVLGKTNLCARPEDDFGVPEKKGHNVGNSQYALCNYTIQRDKMGSRASWENKECHPVSWNGCWIFADTILEATSQATGIGLVMLDENRQLNELVGKTSRTNSSKKAGAEAIREAFVEARRKGWKEILILSDAIEVVLQINGSNEESESIKPILQDIKRLSSEFTVWSCLYLSKDMSRVYNLAHVMADFSLTTNFSHKIIPPFDSQLCNSVRCSTSIVMGGMVVKGVEIML